MLDALAVVAWRRPWTLIGAGVALLATLAVIALGAPDELGIGDDGVGRTAEQPDLVLVTEAEFPARSRVYKVALGAISARIKADPEVAAVSPINLPGDERLAALAVDLAPTDEAARQAAVQRIEGGIDPGPLRVLGAGQTSVLLEARESAGGDLWRLGLLAVPFALLLLVAAFGPRLASAPLICAAIAILGALACLRLAGAFADPSLVGIAPAAALGLVLGIELPALLVARFRDEAALGGPPEEALRRALGHGLPALAFAVVAASLAGAGLLATASAQAGSIVLACAFAGVLALLSTGLVVPAFLALDEHARRSRAAESVDAEDAGDGETVLARILAVLPGALARNRRRTWIATAASLAALGALAAPALDARGTALAPGGLPAEAEPHIAMELLAAAGERPAKAGGDRDESSAAVAKALSSPSAGERSLLGELPLAAVLAAGLLAVAFGLRGGSPRVALLAPAALLPAAAALGVATALFQHGALENMAVVSFLTALAAIGAARCAIALDAVRSERELDPGAAGVAERAGGLTLPAALVATLIGGTAAAVLGGADLYAAREFGVALAAGLAVDLLLVRSCALAALARWALPGRGWWPHMRSVRWRRWRAHRTAEGMTGRPS